MIRYLVCEQLFSGFTVAVFEVRLPLSRDGRGRLAAWHLPGGPVGLVSKWATTSDAEVGQTTYPNTEVGQTTYPANRGMVGREGREGSEGQSHKEEEKEGGREWNRRCPAPLVRDGGLCTWIIVQGPTEFPVTPLLMGPVCLLSQGQFEEPVHLCLCLIKLFKVFRGRPLLLSHVASTGVKVKA